MYCNIPTFLCEVSFSYHMVKVSKISMIFVIIFQAFQYLSFLLPINGWGIWKYNDNVLFSIHKISQYSQIVPIFLIQQYYQTIFNFTVTIALSTIISLTLAFFCFNLNSKQYGLQQLKQLTYWIYLLSSNLLYLPLLYLFTIQVGCYINVYMDTCSQILNQQNIISIICLILIAIFNCSWHYFFCTYTLFPLNFYYQKFSFIAPILNFLNIIVSFLNHANQNDDTVKYICITLLHVIFLINIKECQTQIYSNILFNKIGFAIFSCLEMICIIVTIYIFQESKGMKESDLALFFFLFGSLCFSLASLTHNHNLLSLIKNDNLNSANNCVIFVEVTYQHYQKVKDYQKQASFFELQSILTQNLKEFQYSQNQPKRISKTKDVKKILYKFIKSKLEQFSQQNDNIKYEPLLLIYLSYLDRIFNKPLLGFVELRKYEILENEQSYFFTKMKNKIEENLKKEIVRQQQKKNQLSIFSNLDRTVGQREVQQSLFLQQQILPICFEVLDYKIHLMNQQIQGFQNMYVFYKLALTQGLKVKRLQQQIETFMSTDLDKFDHLSFNLNVIQLKILAIFFGLIMNDYHSTLVCEKTIEEILSYDHSASNDIISNSKLLNNQVTLVKLSMIMDRGLIVNKNKQQLAQYFEYELADFESQIRYIKVLMPQFVSTQHDSILSQYLTTAKSQYFEQFAQIFSRSKDGYLVSQQLSIDNDFTVEDDYVLIGCIHSLKQSYDYILFSDDGKILGMTKAVHQFIVQDQISQYHMDYMLDNSFIFMFFRSIVELISEYKKSLLSGYSQQQETVTTFYCFSKFHQVVELSKKQVLNSIRVGYGYGEKQSSQKTQTLQQGRSQVESSNINNLMDLENNENYGAVTSNANQEQIALSDQVYQERINDFISAMFNIYSSKDLTEYTVRIQLNHKVIGAIGRQKGYFIMEMQDIKKKTIMSMTAETIIQNSQLATSSQLKTTILESKSDNFSYSLNEEPIQEMCPPLMKQPTDVNQLLSKFSPRSYMQNINEDQLLPYDSARESYNLAPLSQRVNFINPSFSKQHQNFIEKDLNDLQFQLEQEVNYSKQLDAQQAQDQEKESKDNGEAPNDSSKQKSNNILAIFKLNKTLKDQHMDAEQENKKSQSSQTSRTSGVSASQIIKNFQRRQSMPPNLRSILLLNLFLTGIVISYIIIMSAVIQSQEASTMIHVDDINGPLYLIRYYMKTFQLSWTLYLTAQNLIINSNYFITQSLHELSQIKLVIVDQLFSYYDNFIRLEANGQIEHVNVSLHNFQTAKVDFLDFYYYMLNLAEEALMISNYTPDTINKIVTASYIDSLLLFRFNLDNLENVAASLIDSIALEFYDILEQKVQNIEIIVIVEIIVFTLIFYSQIFFWKQIQKYIQSIVLIAGRLSEVQQREQIVRITYGKESLDKQVGKQSWMKTNFYNIAYLSLEDANVTKILFQSKLAKQFQNHIQEKDALQYHNIQQQKQYKKSLNTVLNYRILNTKTSVVKIFILMTLTMIIINVYIIGVYAIYKQDEISLLPTQDLQIYYINFITDLDSLVCFAYIIKTQPIIEQYFINNNQSLYQQELDADSIVDNFIHIFNRYDNELNNIFDSIDGSNQISHSDIITLEALYQSDFCTIVPKDIPFCNFANQTFAEFSGKYGIPVSVDDNRQYLSNGIIGITSQINTLLRQSYDYELSNDNYATDLEQMLDVMKTKEFNNAINEHFIDTSIGTTEFFNLLHNNILLIMQDNLNKILIYIYTLGGLLAAFYCIAYVIWIIKTHNELKLIRLILTNLPIDVLTEQHTLSQIKRLS